MEAISIRQLRCTLVTTLVGSIVCVSWNCVPTAAAERPALRFEGLGTHARQISTKSPEAQAWFNQGLAFLYGFNHDEAIRSFHQAAKLDPQAAMPQWAIALANGPHINFPMVDETHAKAAWQALTKARELAAHATPVERELIEALGKRYADPQPEDRKPLDEAYATAMREVWKRHPDDGDIGAMFAEALMDLRPWDLWTHEGRPQPGTDEIVKTLESVMAIVPEHPLALHLYIHAVEASPHPEKGKPAAERLRDLEPGLGHMVHMPSHIDVLVGKWPEAIAANERAIRADSAYRARVPEQEFYRAYMAHNHHMLAFAAMMVGQEKRSTEAIRQMLAEVPQEWAHKNAALIDGMYAMPYEMHLRFGRWEAMLAEPEPPEYFPATRAFRHYARGVAYSAKKQIPEAKDEQSAFLQARGALPEDAIFIFNKASDVLGVGEKMLDGEILYREGKVDEAVAALREAVRREDSLRYIEPPDWIQPVRHVLGATLMDARRFAEAAEVYREDLKHHPENGWSLFSLSQCLRQEGKTDEASALHARFEKVWKSADVKLSSSCFCLPGKK